MEENEEFTKSSQQALEKEKEDLDNSDHADTPSKQQSEACNKELDKILRKEKVASKNEVVKVETDCEEKVENEVELVDTVQQLVEKRAIRQIMEDIPSNQESRINRAKTKKHKL